MNNDLIINVNDSNYETEVLKSELPVLIDFWASWCGPCKVIAPILDSLATEFNGRLKIVKLNVEDSQDIPLQLGVRNIPTLKIFKDGVDIATKVGVAPKNQIIDFINNNI